MSRYLIIIEETSTGYSAYSPDLPGCVATGRTRQEVERALVKAEKSGLRTFQAKGQYLLATALRLSGNPTDAAGHYREAIRLLEEIRNEPKAEKVLQRADLNAIYVDSSRWSQIPKT